MAELKELLIIKKSMENDWYHELEGKMVPFESEDDNFYYLNIRGEINKIAKTDADIAKPIELELPDEIINLIDQLAETSKMTRDELINLMLTEYIKGNKNVK